MFGITNPRKAWTGEDLWERCPDNDLLRVVGKTSNKDGSSQGVSESW